MQIAVSNCGQSSRLLHYDGTSRLYPALATGPLNFGLLPMTEPWPWLQLFAELALGGIIVALVVRGIHHWHRDIEAKLKVRARVEHLSRLRAERKSHTLSQRLLTAHEDERRRLARELHDDVTQRLARLAIDAAQAERGVPRAPDSTNWHSMCEQLIHLSADVHSLAYRLHPAILDELGLVEALRAECDRFSQSESIPVKVEARDVPDAIPGAAALCLFRIGQEALRNVARHARASAVEVSLVGMAAGLQLAVHDNGIGFNPAQTGEHASLGLASMKERVSLVAGKLECISTPGHGTTIVAWTPVPAALKS